MNKILQNFKIQTVVVLLLTLFFTVDSFGQVTRTSAQTGNWNNASTWADLTVTKTGTVRYANNSTTVTGNGTSFLTQLTVGAVIRRTDTNAVIGTVASITNNTSLTLTSNTTSSSGSNGNTWRNYQQVISGVPNANDDVVIANAHSVTVNTNATCASLTMATGGNNSTVTISNTNSLTVNGAVTLNTASSNSVTRTFAVGSGTLTCLSVVLSNSNSGQDSRICNLSLGNGTINVSGNIDRGSGNPSVARNRVTVTGNGTINLVGEMTNNITFAAGTGTVNFNGTNQATGNHNFYNLTTSNAGETTLSATATVGSNGTVRVEGNATLTVAAANLINNNSPIRLNGGTFRTGNTTGYTDQVGVLSLEDDSTIQLGTGNHTLTFANSSSASWTSGKMLTITGWTGNVGAAGTAGKIVFSGNNASGLSSVKLEQIRFNIENEYFAATLLSGGANNGQLVPIATTRVSGFLPATVCQGGTITISGFGFTGATEVRVNGVNVQSFTVVNANTITAVLTDSQTSGIVTVVKNNTNFNGSTSLTVNPIPTNVTASASATNICSGATIDLTSNATSNSSTTVVNSASPNLSIPDNDLTNGVTSQITLPCGSANEITTVTLDITHTWAADLRVYLISPNGTQRSLCVEKGGNSDNIIAIFQAGAQVLPTGNTAINGTYAPDESFSGFSGTASGVWALRVFDDQGVDTGTLNSWSITVNSTTCGVVSYAWTSLPAGFTSSEQNPTGVSPSGTVTYTVTATNSYGCAASASTASVVAGATTTRSGGVWSNGEPNNTVAAIFAENFTISNNFEACSITVNDNVEVIIQSDKSVILEGAINVGNGGKFTLENNATLLQNGNSNPNSDAIVVKRNSSAIKRLDYTLWSSPVVGQGVYAFSPTTLSNRFYTYNTTSDSYNAIGFNLSNLQYPAPLVAPIGINGTDDNNIQFATAKGYLIRVPWNHPTAPAIFAGQFTGVPNSGDITYNMQLNGEGKNLVGNPYPSKLSVVDFIDGNPNIEGTLYFWRKTNDITATTYCTLTKLAYTANPAIGGDTGTGYFNSGDQSNWVINVGQGFFVQADSANAELYFNNGMRRATNNQNQFFRTNGENNANNDFVVEGIYWLNLSNATNSISQIAVGYSPNSTLGVDRGIDGKNINKDLYLASLIDGNDYAIQGRSSFTNTDVVPLSFKIATSGNYSISIDQLSGIFSQGQLIYLKDNALNVVHNLNEGGAYNFTSQAGTFSDRFEVVYANAALGIDNPIFSANQVVVYKNESNQFVVTTGNIEMSSIKVFDIRGRLITSENNINASETTIQADVATQVLLLQITSTDGSIVTKKVIR
jgi:subtilisin-like proprotein convertase family protein